MTILASSRRLLLPSGWRLREAIARLQAD